MSVEKDKEAAPHMIDLQCNMPKPGNSIHIPLKEEDAIRLAFKVKPTAAMPNPGANATGPKKKRTRKKAT